MLFYYLRRPFYGFCFCFQYWPNRLSRPGGLSSRAWMPQPKMPGRVPREVDLFSSYPFPSQQQRKIHGATETRVRQSRRRQMAQASVKRRRKVARRWAEKRLWYLGRVPGSGGIGWRGRARQARRALFTDGVRSGQREESTIQRRDRIGGGRSIRGWPAGRACGTDGTQAASEKRPRQRWSFGGSIVLRFFLPWLIRSFSARLTKFPTFHLARIAHSRGFRELPIPISKRCHLKDVIFQWDFLKIAFWTYLTFLERKAFPLNSWVFTSRTHYANDVNLNYNEQICIKKNVLKKWTTKKKKKKIRLK